jgi:hypothetical protein
MYEQTKAKDYLNFISELRKRFPRNSGSFGLAAFSSG